MEDGWCHLPVLIERSSSFDVTLAMEILSAMNPGEQVYLDFVDAASDGRSPWVRDGANNRLGRIPASQWQRFYLVHGDDQSTVGEFARRLEFGWLLRLPVKSRGNPERLSSIL